MWIPIPHMRIITTAAVVLGGIAFMLCGRIWSICRPLSFARAFHLECPRGSSGSWSQAVHNPAAPFPVGLQLRSRHMMLDCAAMPSTSSASRGDQYGKPYGGK